MSKRSRRTHSERIAARIERADAELTLRSAQEVRRLEMLERSGVVLSDEDRAYRASNYALWTQALERLGLNV